jgi:hypothetical protein
MLRQATANLAARLRLGVIRVDFGMFAACSEREAICRMMTRVCVRFRHQGKTYEAIGYQSDYLHGAWVVNVLKLAYRMRGANRWRSLWIGGEPTKHVKKLIELAKAALAKEAA